MKSTMTAVGAALIGAAFAAAPASAEQNYGTQQPLPQPTVDRTQQDQPEQQSEQAAPAAQQPQSPTAIRTHVPKVSRKAVKPIQEFQNAVKANNTAAIPAALAAAQAAASTAEDRYAIAIVQLQAAATARNQPGIAAAIESMLASGAVAEEEKFSLYYNLGQSYAAANQYDRAAQAYQQALQINPSSVDATAGLAELKVSQGQPGEAISLLQKGIALQSAGGARPSETWYKRAVAVAYKAKLPQAVQISRDWVRAYPTSSNWSDAIAIYQNVAQLDESQTLDLLRLKRAAGSLSAGDYFTYGDIALRKGLSGEAKAVIEEGFAASAIKRTDPSFRELHSLASQRTKGDRESLPAAPVASANARQTMIIGDAYYGYGDYAKAIEFYKAALAKPGADANLINLHIGMALARQGDAAGANAALGAVSGPQAEIARYWQLYASTKA